ncbi:hypothetical protein HYQ44_020457 [Verticillium longisporum]|nr:hypothetical protein HYQ44_020457 [Verticillium longisporum]
MSQDERSAREVKDHLLFEIATEVAHRGLSFNLLALLFLAHYFIPKAQPHTAKFFTLSYRNPATGSYKNGCDDMYFIAFCLAKCLKYMGFTTVCDVMFGVFLTYWISVMFAESFAVWLMNLGAAAAAGANVYDYMSSLSAF